MYVFNQNAPTHSHEKLYKKDTESRVNGVCMEKRMSGIRGDCVNA